MRWRGEGADLMKSLGAIVGIAVLLATAATSLRAQDDDFPITGTYTENQLCKGDGSDANAPRVKIGPKEIESSVFGLCTIRNRKRDGNKFAVSVECKGPGGAVMVGEVIFTVRDSSTLDFADQDNTYKAVLHKCQG
jgi:hypothetical protein